MRRSFVRLVVGSVLISWALGFVVLILYSKSRSWTEDEARRDGVFLIRELLEQEPAATRALRLDALREHVSVDLALITLAEMERRVGKPVEPGASIPHGSSALEAWYFLAFEDGEGALAAGPVNPSRPAGAFPIGLVIAIVGLPLLAGLLALRVDRGLRAVERASFALAVGDLGARVEHPQGPSTELAARFNEMAERVERLVRSRDELVQAVSHELGSPLSRLRFHLELQETDPDARRGERLPAMARELDALDDLVAELLGYVQADEVTLNRQSFGPSRILSDLAELARLDAPHDRPIGVELTLPDGATMSADPRLFQRAVENLLRNAVQHARSKVRLELSEAEHEIRVAVHDDGPGIPEELREKVVTPFYRLEADRNRKTGGAGLGLAIVSRVLNRHGGRLEIDDSPLGGATVATIWPRRGEHIPR